MTKDTLSQASTAPLVQAQHSGFCLHRAGRRHLTKPLCGISLGRSSPLRLEQAGGAGRRVTVPSRQWLGTRQGAKEHNSGIIFGSEMA